LRPLADVVIPVKKLSESKTRLSEILTLEDRQRLVLIMLEDVLASLRKSSLVGQVFVTTPDRHVVDCVSGLGVKAIMDVDGQGINESIERVAKHESDLGRPSPLLVLPVDIPLVKSGTIDGIIGKLEDNVGPLVVISPSRSKGTNALLRNPPSVIPTRYGVNSFEAHFEEAVSRKIPLIVYRSADLEVDLDTPSDLREIMEKGNSTKTSKFLCGIFKAARVES
jgi:2-phospho-L-lactate guanylyltransferase